MTVECSVVRPPEVASKHNDVVGVFRLIDDLEYLLTLSLVCFPCEDHLYGVSDDFLVGILSELLLARVGRELRCLIGRGGISLL